MQECPDCGTLVADGLAICSSCGYGLLDRTRTCEHCRETIAADAEACPACGHFAVPGTCDRHPDREAPGQCALCGLSLCEECEAGDRYHACEDHADVRIVEGWAEVLALPNELQAQLIEENLQAEGIDSRILSKKDHFAIPVEFGDLAHARVLVPTYAYQEAQHVLEAHRDSVGDVAFGCPSCGTPYEEGRTECAECGERLV